MKCPLLASVLLSTLISNASAADSLQFFKNYFITGDYTVAGIGLSGKGVGGMATGNVVISGVPANADIVAAFLYWQTIELRDGEGERGKFRGFNIVGKPLGNRTSPCWSSGGATGASNGAHALRVYRTDVMRYLPAANGKRLANGSHAVSLPDSGGGNKAPFTEGASLVVIYRDPAMPFKSVVLYDGAFTMDRSNQAFNVTIKGFYQASSVNPSAKLTHIVGDGQPNFSERLLFNGAQVGLNPFRGTAGPAWDNPTSDVSALTPRDASAVSTSVERPDESSFDCLSWAAVVFSTTVQDTDGDALLDTWERNGLTEISDGSFVDLPALGANPSLRDLFIEIDYMTSASHSHKPDPAALEMVRKAFAEAPVPIRVHFDTASTGILEKDEPKFAGYQGVVGWKSGLIAVKEKYFAHNRKDIFRYALFAHALGLPVNPPTTPATLRTTSGIADLLGGDMLITLGLWRSDIAAEDQRGSVQQQAGTLMHELGHTLGLRHGGSDHTPGCKPNYQSVMNYLFQTRGLVKASGETVVDYSNVALPPIAESALSETPGLGNAFYRARYYAPPGYLNAYISSFGTRYPTRYCDGSPVRPFDPPVVKVDAATVGGYIDWNNDGIAGPVTSPLDVNFSGATEPVLTGFNDWAAIDLRQIGARRNARGLSGDIASGDIASGDIASGDIASGDIASGDIASGVMDQLDIDYETFNSVVDAPAGLTATVNSLGILLNWTAPPAGVIRKYSIYRATGAISPTQLPVLIATISGTPPTRTYTDTHVTHGISYTYFVTASNVAQMQSGASNMVTITK